MIATAAEVGLGELDFGRSAIDYAEHRAGFPAAFFDRMSTTGLVTAGETLLDVGTGTGTLARGFARLGLRATGLDISVALLAQARRLAERDGLDVTFTTGTAEHTGFPDGAFDIVTAGQCWHWFDRPAVAAELKRVLKAGGRLIVAHFDWLPYPGLLAEATEALILRHNPSWRMSGGMGIHPRWFADLAGAGFAHLQSFSFDVEVPYTTDAWMGRIRASAGVGAALDEDGVRAFDRDHRVLIDARYPDGRFTVLHRVFAVWGTRNR